MNYAIDLINGIRGNFKKRFEYGKSLRDKSFTKIYIKMKEAKCSLFEHWAFSNRPGQIGLNIAKGTKGRRY